MGDGAADGTSEGEPGVELKAAHLLGSRGDLLGDLLDGGGGVGRHYYDTISILYSNKIRKKKRWTRKTGEGVDVNLEIKMNAKLFQKFSTKFHSFPTQS